MESKLLRTMQSRKFWAALIGLVLIVVTTWGQDPYPTDAVVTAIMGVVGAYVAATAYEDGKHAEAAGKQQTTVSTGSSNVEITTSDRSPHLP